MALKRKMLPSLPETFQAGLTICLLCALITPSTKHSSHCLRPFACLILERQDRASALKADRVGLNSKY